MCGGITTISNQLMPRDRRHRWGAGCCGRADSLYDTKMAINNRGLWPYTVQVGDILRFPSGDLRVVRYAKNGKSGYTTYVGLAIRRRSWTNRAYTIISYVDLKCRGARPVGRMKKMDSEISLKLADCMTFDNRFMENQKLFAGDVVGVVP